MSPRHGYRRTVLALFALLMAAVALAVPYHSLFSSKASPDLALAASLNVQETASQSVPVVHSVQQNDLQSARIAQVSAREAYNARMMKRKARLLAREKAAARAARAEARAEARAATLAAAQSPSPSPSASPAPPSVVPAAQGDPQQIAEGMLGSYGWSSSEFSCLQPLWNAESGWNVYASNPGSGAYGIPQALPGSKMASAGADWQTSATVQVTWGLGYIKSAYGTPCNAWSHERAYGWY